MITDEQFNRWLKDGTGSRCVLVEAKAKVGGVETTVYLSNKGYLTGPSDNPPNQSYTGCIEGGVRITEQIGLTSASGISYGDIEIDNTSGVRDHWLTDYIWTNRDIAVYFGDRSWARSDFRRVYVGIVADVSTRSRNRVNLKLRDKMQRLNAPVTEKLLGGITDNKEQVLPLTFGEVCNIEPLLIDPGKQQYQFHQGLCERLIEVRDDGAPVSVDVDLASGTFKLKATAKGTITCSVQGHRNPTYTNTAAGIIQRLVMNYGKESDRFSADDIALDNFQACETLFPQAVGVYINDKSNLLEQCNALAASIGAQVCQSRAGKMRMYRMGFPAIWNPEWNPVSINESNIVAQSLKIADMSEIVASYKLGYCKNWAVQSNLQTGIPQENKDLLAKEYMTVTATDDAVAAERKLTTLPEEVDTLLLNTDDATAEAKRRLDMTKVRRTTFEFIGFSELINIELGTTVMLTNPRFGLKDGKVGLVVKVDPDWMAGRITMQVMI